MIPQIYLPVTSFTSLYSAAVKKITTFVSYAHADASLAKKLMDALEPLFKTSAGWEFSNWSDHELLPGEGWRDEIEQALDKADFGLLLLSPQFLARTFITDKELPRLLAKRMVVPVALRTIPLDGTMNLRGLEDRQIFRDARDRPFEKCRLDSDRGDFALELMGKINKMLAKYA
jgi:hypothetical protein